MLGKCEVPGSSFCEWGEKVAMLGKCEVPGCRVVFNHFYSFSIFISMTPAKHKNCYISKSKTLGPLFDHNSPRFMQRRID